MSNVSVFNFEASSVRTIIDDKGEVLFVGKDVCEVLGYSNPNKAMNDHCKGITIRYPLQTAGGMQEFRVLTEADTMRLIISSKLDSAVAFEAWVFEEVLPSIRKTGSFSVKEVVRYISQDPVVRAAEMAPSLIVFAEAIGLDKNAAIISANQAAYKQTGINLLQLTDNTHLVSLQQATHFTPTEIGKQMGISAREVNIRLMEAGLQNSIEGKWEMTHKGMGYGRLLDTGKKHSSGTPVTQLKWLLKVKDLI